MFGLKPKSKFMLLIGEEGVILLYFKNNTLNKRYFIQNINDNATSELKSCLLSDKKAPLYLVLNHTDQNYTLQSIPGISRVSAYLSVKAKMGHFTRNYDINSAFLVARPNESSNYWHYLCVSSKADNLIEYWLNMLIEVGSNFKGILMFPIEVVNAIKGILHNSTWQIIVVATKTGGYRQVVLKDNKMVFTLLTPFGNESLPGVIAGGIYQEVRNTIQSLTKFGFKKNNRVDLCMVVPEDIKTSLSVIKFSENDVKILTPYELVKLLGSELAISETDNFCDTVILFHSFKNNPIAVFNTKKTKEFHLFGSLYLNSPRVFTYCILILIVMNISYLLNLRSNFHTADKLSVKEQTLNNKLLKISQSYNVKKTEEIYDFININNMLSKVEYSPLAQVKYVDGLKVPYIELQSFKWSYNEIKNSITTTLNFNFQSDQNITHSYSQLQNKLYSNFRTKDVSISRSSDNEKSNTYIGIEIREVM